MSDLYRLVYASKNLVQGSDADKRDAVDQILKASQANNSKVGVTGALMFNNGAFAQVLEGPRRGVEDTFERIQQDPRHGDVTVLQCGPVADRGFKSWSMAFVGESPRGRELWSSLAAQSGFELSRLSGDAVFTMLHDLVRDEEDLPSVLPGSPANAQPEATTSMNVEQQRAEIMPIHAEWPTLSPVSTYQPGVVSAAEGEEPRTGRDLGSTRVQSETAFRVLKAALASERQLTTELRHELDGVRISLAELQEDLRWLREERDLWAKRAHLLAKVLQEEAAEIGSIPSQEHRSVATKDRRNRPGGMRAA